MNDDVRISVGQNIMLQPSQRSGIESFIVMDVMRMAAAEEAAGRHVIHMEVGQPSTPAPKAAREAAKRAIDHDTLGYTLALGLNALRERIARYYTDTYDVDVEPERVVVTTGSSMLPPDRLRDLIDVCSARGMWFISDEIYHGLTYGAPAATALQYSQDAIVINSFSKYFSMTGWRVGWMIVPPSLVRVMERLAQNLYIAPPAIAQMAALGSFDGISELEANK